MVNWIMQCVSTTTFSLSIDEDRIGYFKGGKGLRQGNPMSLYLFTLIMKVFTILVRRQVARNPSFQYHFGCNAMKITHVCFADELLVMCHGDVGSAMKITH
ncbi:RNA-directed DNA polymerase, eukaryota, reverse transcriptase zinc-binding domain protein, partial [Tanacetum coccineum]